MDSNNWQRQQNNQDYSASMSTRVQMDPNLRSLSQSLAQPTRNFEGRISQNITIPGPGALTGPVNNLARVRARLSAGNLSLGVRAQTSSQTPAGRSNPVRETLKRASDGFMLAHDKIMRNFVNLGYDNNLPTNYIPNQNLGDADCMIIATATRNDGNSLRIASPLPGASRLSLRSIPTLKNHHQSRSVVLPIGSTQGVNINDNKMRATPLQSHNNINSNNYFLQQPNHPNPINTQIPVGHNYRLQSPYDMVNGPNPIPNTYLPSAPPNTLHPFRQQNFSVGNMTPTLQNQNFQANRLHTPVIPTPHGHNFQAKTGLIPTPQGHNFQANQAQTSVTTIPQGQNFQANRAQAVVIPTSLAHNIQANQSQTPMLPPPQNHNIQGNYHPQTRIIPSPQCHNIQANRPVIPTHQGHNFQTTNHAQNTALAQNNTVTSMIPSQNSQLNHAQTPVLHQNMMPTTPQKSQNTDQLINHSQNVDVVYQNTNYVNLMPAPCRNNFTQTSGHGQNFGSSSILDTTNANPTSSGVNPSSFCQQQQTNVSNNNVVVNDVNSSFVDPTQQHNPTAASSLHNHLTNPNSTDANTSNYFSGWDDDFSDANFENISLIPGLHDFAFDIPPILESSQTPPVGVDHDSTTNPPPPVSDNVAIIQPSTGGSDNDQRGSTNGEVHVPAAAGISSDDIFGTADELARHLFPGGDDDGGLNISFTEEDEDSSGKVLFQGNIR